MAVAERKMEMNEKIRRINGTTRQEIFEAQEASQLQPLPDDPFEFVEYKQLKYGWNYHFSTNCQRYSVPYKLAVRFCRCALSLGSSRFLTVLQQFASTNARMRGKANLHS